MVDLRFDASPGPWNAQGLSAGHSSASPRGEIVMESTPSSSANGHMYSTNSASTSMAQPFASTSQWPQQANSKQIPGPYGVQASFAPSPALQRASSASHSGGHFEGTSQAQSAGERVFSKPRRHFQDPLSQSDATSSQQQSSSSFDSSVFDRHSQPSQSSQETGQPSQSETQTPQSQSNSIAEDRRPSLTTSRSKSASFADAAIPSGRTVPKSPPSVAHMDLATYPSTELLRILAMLLQQIATANDDLRPRGGENHRRGHGRDGQSSNRDERMADATSLHSHGRMQRSESSNSTPGAGTRSRSGSMRAGQEGLHGGDSSRSKVTTAAQAALMTPSSTLCFHARNVPTINVESYLLRILKYCPTTNEVFLSLLVYFDRMSRMGSGAGPGEDNKTAPAGQAAGLPPSRTREISASFGELSADGQDGARSDTPDTGPQREPRPGMRGFAIDSFNVHRLIIAGLTVSSKFFSDVFYTNSRYAKVGGLPAHELNQLELQFLLLNDFHLVIPLDELQRYADQLLVYGKGQQQTRSIPRPVAGTSASSRDGQDRDRNRVRTGGHSQDRSTTAAGGVAAGGRGGPAQTPSHPATTTPQPPQQDEAMQE